MSIPPITTTTALLHTLRSRQDGEVWDEFVRRYAPILRALAQRIGLSAEDAADAAQQTLLEFVRDMREGRFDRSRGRLRSWILTIAEHRCRDIQRRARSRGPAVPLPEAEDARQSTLESWWEDEERSQIAAAAWAEVRAAGCADAASLHAFELMAIRQVPPAEVARQLDMSVGAVYAAKYRIARRMRASIERLTAAYREGPA